MLSEIGVMKGITTKMGWLNQRHAVMSRNIAHADTPNYQPRDLKELDYASVMNKARNKPSIHVAGTDNGHINATGNMGNAKVTKTKTVYESAPAGNAVIIEEQLMLSQTTLMDFQMMTNLYRKNVGMIKMVLGQR